MQYGSAAKIQQTLENFRQEGLYLSQPYGRVETITGGKYCGKYNYSVSIKLLNDLQY